jgi:hypothetical protein
VLIRVTFSYTIGKGQGPLTDPCRARIKEISNEMMLSNEKTTAAKGPRKGYLTVIEKGPDGESWPHTSDSTALYVSVLQLTM